MKILILALMISLNGCKNPNSYPRIEDQEQLTPIFRYIEIEGIEYIDIDSSYCLSRIYRISKGYIGKLEKPVKLHISECNKVIGYAPDEYGVFAKWLENFRVWLLAFKRR